MVKIFVGRLAENVTTEDLQKIFEKFGEVSDCDILRDYGFVHMADENRAREAIRELDKMELRGNRISVELSTSRSMKSCQLTVGNLPDGTSSADVHKLFKKYGTVTLCRIVGNQASVHMRWASMAVQAIRNLNGETYKGNVLSVQFSNNTNSLPDEWPSSSAVSPPSLPVPVPPVQSGNASGPPRYPNSAPLPTPPSGNSNFTPAWTNFVTSPPQTNHVLSNGMTNANFSMNPGTNQNNNLSNSLQSNSVNLPPLMPLNPPGNQKDGNGIGDAKIPHNNNNMDKMNNQNHESPSHTGILSSSYEDANKKVEVSKSRAERRQFIQQGLQFLQSPRPWSGTPEEYANFLNQIKQMLLQEGIELKRESAFSDAVQKLSEALNMCKYMESEGINGHNSSLVILLVERSSALLELGQTPSAMEDANRALQISNGGSQEAMRCKAKAMIKFGNAKESYDMMMQYARNNNLDKESTELMNNLSQMLGLRTRKPYQPFAPFNNMPHNNDILSGGKLEPPGFSKQDPNQTMPQPSLNKPPMDNFGNTTITNDIQGFRSFPNTTDAFSNSFADQSFKSSHNDPPGPMQNMPGFMNRPPIPPGQMANMSAFNKTPGTALHGFPPGMGAPFQPSTTNPPMNGGLPQKPIGPSRPVGSRILSNPYGGFQSVPQANDPPSIADSLRKNLEIMTGGDNQTGSMFGQGGGMRNNMDSSLDLVSGIQKLAVSQQLNENGLNNDVGKTAIGSDNQASKLWDYMGNKMGSSNNALGNGIGYNSGLPAPIGYRKPFGVGGDTSGLISPPSNVPGSSPFLNHAGDSPFNMNRDNSMKGSLIGDIKAPGRNQDPPFGMNIQNSSTVMSSSNQFGAIRLSSDPTGYSHTGPSYSHFPQSSGHPTGLSQLFGPGAIGIGIQNAPPPQMAQKIQLAAQPTAASIVLSQKAYSEQSEDSLDMMNPDEDESLDSYLRNPLHNTHEFCLGCSDCVIKTGSRVVDYRYDENLNHMCYKNILLCRRRDSVDWHKIRPRPQPQSKAQLYDGPYYICKDLLAGSDCTYPVVCTFAYNQEEIDVWTLERKQMLNRRWLFDSLDEDYMRELSVVGRVLCKHRGLFNFLCQACFTNKPRIISTFNLSTGTCINADAEHQESPDNRQLTHILRDTTVRYTSIRVPAQQAILCRHEVRFQCTREEDCHFAHSLVERDVWALMIKKGLTPDQIVEQSREYITKLSNNTNTLEQGITQTTDLGVPMFRWKVKFICSLCYKNGQISEATKDRKYCTARAQHSWATNKKTVLVQTIRKDWTQIRDLPYLKNKGLPARFELCENIRRQKKCPFSNKCNFAHSQEELDIWIYLRDNQLKDLEELHDSLNRDKQPKATRPAVLPLQNTIDPNAIRLPTDFLPQSAYHCWLCNKECNGQRQWDQHCLSVKHRLGALSDSDGNWKYRNPGGNYEICERHLKNICEYDCVAPVDNKCRNAHSIEELEEWKQRREYVLNRIKKAQNDQLISAADNMDKLIKESQQHQQ
uniref:uncharacterized protein LOC120333481 isoform X1 n=1 Tax=Styela clava TaxID=7725 RepID=UPI00193A44A2|nr:uncharacterized protein LOC120333481 isoform X1 [Styela clava]